MSQRPFLNPIDYREPDPAFLQELLGINARVILEIGAHHGWHTELFLQLFEKATIYAFEPDPRALLEFKSSITDSRVHLFEIAIGAEDGEAKFHMSGGLPANLPEKDLKRYPQGWDQSGSLRRPKHHLVLDPWCTFDQTINVKVRTLDSWSHENGIDKVDFIWADMQGAEGDLIKCGQATLTRTRYLYLEYSNNETYEGEPTLATLLDLLPTFSVVQLYPDNVLLKNMAFDRD